MKFFGRDWLVDVVFGTLKYIFSNKFTVQRFRFQRLFLNCHLQQYFPGFIGSSLDKHKTKVLIVSLEAVVNVCYSKGFAGGFWEYSSSY